MMSNKRKPLICKRSSYFTMNTCVLLSINKKLFGRIKHENIIIFLKIKRICFNFHETRTISSKNKNL